MDNSSRRILVVDDEIDIQFVISMLLEDEGYVTYTANNGKEAIEVLKAQSITMVLSGYMMPVMDGFGLLSWLNNHESEVPLIMISGRGDVETKKRAMGLGAIKYILKSFQADEIMKSVRQVLNDMDKKIGEKEEIDKCWRTKCWCCQSCLSRLLLLNSGILLERRSYFEWKDQVPQREAGPVPDRGAISYFATIWGTLSAVLPVF